MIISDKEIDLIRELLKTNNTKQLSDFLDNLIKLQKWLKIIDDDRGVQKAICYINFDDYGYPSENSESEISDISDEPNYKIQFL